MRNVWKVEILGQCVLPISVHPVRLLLLLVQRVHHLLGVHENIPNVILLLLRVIVLVAASLLVVPAVATRSLPDLLLLLLDIIVPR